MVSREDQCRRGPRHRSGATWSEFFVFPNGPGGGGNLSVAEVEAKGEVDANSEEVKLIEDIKDKRLS